MKKSPTEKQSRNWYLVDAKDKILGRLATQIANLLRGKNKPEFSPWLDIGDYVVIINAAKVRVTGKKIEQKVYYHHSGYPGGLKKETLKEIIKEKPEEVIKRAISGMLPKNKLKNFWLKRLYVYKTEEHPYKDKNLKKIEIGG